MNELRRMAYLDALGIDCYVSRTQLPGAALTRRLAIVSRPVRTPDVKTPVPGGDTAQAGVKAIAGLPQTGVARRNFGVSAHSRNAVDEPPREPLPQRSEPVPRFSLSTIAAGEWLWLEDLQGMPLTTEQVQLVQSMAQALVLRRGMGSDNAGTAEVVATARPHVAQFDWPMHTNRQLDLGESAARASVAAFVSRKLEQHGCRGLVLLGQPCVQRVPLAQIKVVAVSTTSSAEILANPALKRQVWRDLQPLLGHS